jgi:hypothetical protein
MVVSDASGWTAAQEVAGNTGLDAAGPATQLNANTETIDAECRSGGMALIAYLGGCLTRCA